VVDKLSGITRTFCKGASTAMPAFSSAETLQESTEEAMNDLQLNVLL
jgi:hypothetical protein